MTHPAVWYQEQSGRRRGEDRFWRRNPPGRSSVRSVESGWCTPRTIPTASRARQDSTCPRQRTAVPPVLASAAAPPIWAAPPFLAQTGQVEASTPCQGFRRFEAGHVRTDIARPDPPRNRDGCRASTRHCGLRRILGSRWQLTEPSWHRQLRQRPATRLRPVARSVMGGSARPVRPLGQRDQTVRRQSAR